MDKSYDGIDSFSLIQIKQENPSSNIQYEYLSSPTSANEKSSDHTEYQKYFKHLEETLQLTLAEKENLSKEIAQINLKLSQQSHELTIQKDTCRKLQLEAMKLKLNSDCKIKEITQGYERDISNYKKIISDLKTANEHLKFRLRSLEGNESLIPTPESDGCFVTSSIEKSVFDSINSITNKEHLPDIYNNLTNNTTKKESEIEIIEARSIRQPRIQIQSPSQINTSADFGSLIISPSIENGSSSRKSASENRRSRVKPTLAKRQEVWINNDLIVSSGESSNNVQFYNNSADHTTNKSISIVPHLNLDIRSSTSTPSSISISHKNDNDNESSDFYYDDDDIDDEDDEFVAHDDDSDFEIDKKKRKKKKVLYSSAVKRMKPATNKKPRKLSPQELELLIQNFPTVSFKDAKKLLLLERPDPISRAKHLPFQNKEQRNMLRLVIGYGHYGHAYRKYFWTEHMPLFQNRVEGTVVQHWRNGIVQKPDDTRALLIDIGFDEAVTKALLEMIAKIGIAEDDSLDMTVSIVKREEFTELTKFLIMREEDIKNNL